MTPKEMACSRENGEKIKALGVTVDSFWCHAWIRAPNVVAGKRDGWKKAPTIRMSEMAKREARFLAPAYTCAELLGVILLHSECKSYEIININPDFLAEDVFQLIEQGHLTVEEINGEVIGTIHDNKGKS